MTMLGWFGAKTERLQPGGEGLERVGCSVRRPDKRTPESPPAAAGATVTRSAAQHSITLTASPPRAVSLYLVFMSAPVSRIVLITWSSDT